MKKHQMIIWMMAMGMVILPGLRAADNSPATSNKQAEEFIALKTQIVKAGATATEADMLKLLRMGTQAGMAVEAGATLRNYMITHSVRSPDLLRLGAENAALGGDLKTAAGRYKQYLDMVKGQPSNPQISQAVTELYRLQVEFLNDHNGAFRLMSGDAAPFRQSPDMRKYDTWFLNIALERAYRDQRAPTEAVEHLVRVFNDKLPLEQERYYYWGYLDEIMEGIYGKDTQKTYDPLPAYRALVPLIREDAQRSARYGFYVANLDFLAGSAGKELASLEREREAVINSAKSYVDAFPTFDTLTNVMWVLSSRYRDFAAYAGQNHEFFSYAFGKLSPADRQKVLTWDYRFSAVDSMTWMKIGTSFPQDLAASSGIRSFTLGNGLPWDMEPGRGINTPEHYQAMLPFLKGVHSEGAAQVRALAAAGNQDAARGMQSLLNEDSWHLDFTSFYDIFNRALWPSFIRMPRDEAHAVPPAAMGQAFASFGMQAASTPIVLFDPRVAKDTVTYTIQDGDKATLPKLVQALAWVPWDDKTRADVFAPGAKLLAQWAQNERAQAEDQRKVADNVIAQWEVAMSNAVFSGAPSVAAPNPLCAALGKLYVAEKAGNQADFIKASQATYDLVANWNESRAAFALPALKQALTSRVKDLDNLDFQCAILKQCLAAWHTSPAAAERAQLIFGLMQANRNNWYAQPPVAERENLRKVNTVIEQALLEQLNQNRFAPEVFEWFRKLRGPNNNDWSFGTNLVAALVAKKQAGSMASLPSADVVMWVALRETPADFAKEYPADSFFEDMVAADIQKTKSLGNAYNYYSHGGKDIKGSIGTAAAKLLQEYDAMPFGYGGVAAPCPRDKVSYWYSKALAAPTDKAAREALARKMGEQYGTQFFDPISMTYGLPPYGDLQSMEGRRAYFDKTTPAYLDRLKTAPGRVALNWWFGRLTTPADGALTSDEITDLLRVFQEYAPPQLWRNSGIVRWEADYGLAAVVPAFCDALVKQERLAELADVVPNLWKFAGDLNNVPLMGYLATLCRRLSDQEQYATALTCSQSGLHILEGVITSEQKETITAVMSKSRRLLARDIIPVTASDPKYEVYRAQAEWYAGSIEPAWRLYQENAKLVPTMLTDLDPEFCIWLIERNTAAENFERADLLAKHMMQWADSVRVAVDPQVRAKLLLAYAQIAFARREYPAARAQLQRIVSNRDFEGTRAAIDAAVQIADIDRITKNYENAVTVCEEIKRDGDPYAVRQANYVLAKVKYDQEDFSETREILEDLISRDPDFDEAKILHGQMLLQIRRFQDASDLEIGPSVQRKLIIPGRPLKVSLYDKNADFSSGASSIELRLWTDSGDEEFAKLLPHGDIKRRFQVEIPVELAPVNKGDQKLQVVGSDKVHYDFSEHFKRLHNITNVQEHVLTVASDAELYASSGKILTREEEEQIQLARLVGMDRFARGKLEELEAVKLSDVRVANQVKPGNMINVRVLDLDRSLTREKDFLEISVESSSGDAITALKLQETDTHSGVFEGQIPTAAGQPMAFADSTAENRNPNYVVSFKDYPAWLGAPEVEGKSRMRQFMVDLNDNVALDAMRITAQEPQHHLKKFYLQTSLQRDHWVTCGVWPGEWQTWDGSMQVRMMRVLDAEARKARELDFSVSITGLVNYLERLGGIDETPMVTLTNLSAATIDLDKGAAPYAGQLGIGNVASNEFILHLRGAFYMPVRKLRTFQVKRFDAKEVSESEKEQKSKTRREEPAYVFAIDGKVAESTKKHESRGGGPLFIRRALSKGVHQVDLFVLAFRDEKVAFELLTDAEGTNMAVCSAAMFDPQNDPRISEAVQTPVATITANDDATRFDVRFTNSNARAFRLGIMDYEGDAPAINKILLQNRQGERVLPTKYDFMDLRENDVLEVLPGDKITITYKDPVAVSSETPVHTATLQASYTDGQINACFVEYVSRPGGYSEPVYIPMWRFVRGDPVNVFIRDPDLDVSEKKDVVKFEAKNISGKTITAEAIETGEHTGVFVGRILPVSGEAKRPFEIQCQEDDTLTISYLDKENLDPGVPWARVVSIDSSFYVDPEVHVYDTSSRRIELGEQEVAEEVRAETPIGMETYWVTRELTCQRLDKIVPAKPVAVAAADLGAAAENDGSLEQTPAMETTVAGDQSGWPTYYLGGPLMMEVIWPTVVLSPLSKIHVYAQTSSGRARFGKPLGDDDFDIAVPGTISLAGSAGRIGETKCDPQYDMEILGDPFAAETAVEDGRFTFSFPVSLGELPAKSLVERDEETGKIKALPASVKNELVVNGKDVVYVAFEYEDKAGRPHRAMQKFRVKSDGFLDILDRNSEKKPEGLFVGEKIYFRVVDKARDLSDEKDVMTVELKTGSGTVVTNHLMETLAHSGQFIGFAKAVSLDEMKLMSNTFDIVPCAYGDDVVVHYQASSGEKLEARIYVYKGADGEVHQFTKRFKDPDIAVQTQFAMAEAYFELAKKHRRLKQEELARREIKQGKKLLEEALRDFPDAGARDQAEYLLANLSLEFAEDTVDVREKERLLSEAVSRFTEIVSTYIDSQYAPKSQYKKALCYEKLGQMDQACEEYVKLAYTYPEHELIAETIARLGQYFWNKARDTKKAADELKATGKDVNVLEAEKLYKQTKDIYITSGEVFGRLSSRFPNHKLAGQTKVLSGQAFLQAQDYNRAVAAFAEAMDRYKDDKVLMPEAAYWTGHCYFLMDQLEKAYMAWKKLTWDYPESKWAKYARGRLTDPGMAKVAETLSSDQ